MTIYEVREILGHTDIKTTMRYAHSERRQVTAKARDVINGLTRGQSTQVDSDLAARVDRDNV